MDGSSRLRWVLGVGLTLLGLVASGAVAYNEPDDAMAFLEELEKAGCGITALQADVRYVRTFAIAGDTQTRVGSIYYSAPGARQGEHSNRSFAIDFEKLLVGDRIENIRERYIFDGQWLLELDYQTHHYTRRQIVPPGETFDPLRIGEGPFPIPIGQKAEAILARYDATLLPEKTGLHNATLVEHIQGAVQIRLTPRAFYAEESEFDEVRLWYAKDDQGVWLPRMAKTVNHAGDEAIVMLKDIRINDDARIPDMDTTPPKRGWDGQVLQWRDDTG